MDYQEKLSRTIPGEEKPSWSSRIIIALVIIWIYAIIFIAYPFAWGIEQIMMILGLDWPVWLIPVIKLIASVFILIPIGLLELFWHKPRYQAILKCWGLSALFIYFIVPVHFIQSNHTQLANVLQIIGATGYILVVKWVYKIQVDLIIKRLARQLASVASILLILPWIIWSWWLWGALGSGLDTLLNLISGLLLGVAVGITISPFIYQDLAQKAKIRIGDILRSSLVMSTSLVMMAAAFGFNGSEILLMLIIPPLGLFWMIWFSTNQKSDENLSINWLWFSQSIMIGVVAAMPLLWVDPDELNLQLNLGTRDIMYWGIAAAAMTALSIWFLSFLLYLIRRPFSRILKKSILTPLAIALWLGLGILYFVFGQPGFYGDHLFVVLNDQLDVSSAKEIKTFVQRRQYVYSELINHSNQTQGDLRRALDLLKIKYTPYYLVNSLDIDAEPVLMAWLALRPEIKVVDEIPVLRPLPEINSIAIGQEPAPSQPQWNLTNIGADRVWKELGVTGKGIVIGQSDSGVQWDHPELKTAYRGFDKIKQSVMHDYNWLDPWNQTTQPTDIIGHGTHTLGTMVGKNVGVAPGAVWFGCVNQARNMGNPSHYLDCMQFLFAPYPLQGDPFKDGDPKRGAHILNNSWGCPNIEGCKTDTLLPAVRALKAAGVFIVASAGNEGSRCSSIDTPLAIYDEVLTVGAVDSWNRLAEFSSRGPVLIDGSIRTKPDLLAPGVDILSSYPGNSYMRLDGTSMAGPHVAGVVALMWSANPNLIGDIDGTEKILKETAQAYPFSLEEDLVCSNTKDFPNNAVGYGLVDAYYASVSAAQQIH